MAAVALGVAAPAQAHQSTVVYSQLVLQARTVEYTFQISNADLYEAIGLDRDRPVEKPEVERASGRLLDYLAGRVQVKNGDYRCAPRPRDVSTIDKAGGFFVLARIDFECKRMPSDVTVRYDLFFDLDPRHQGLARIVVPGAEPRQHIFRSGDRLLHLSRPVRTLDYLRDYLFLGIEHIFTGYDHLAFLFGLLIIAGSKRARPGLRYLVGIVTAFTVAHSCTLIASALGWVRLDSRLVEPAIALSIAYVAVENLTVAEPRRRSLITFGFGLVHGFGFASVLREIGLPPRGLVLSLLSFNAGVELAQLAVVLLIFPFLRLLARGRLPAAAAGGVALASILVFGLLAQLELPPVQLGLVVIAAPLLLLGLVPRLGYDRAVRVGGSVVLALLAGLWFVERVLARSFLGGQLG